MTDREAQLRELMESDARIWAYHIEKQLKRDKAFNDRKHRSVRLAIKRGEPLIKRA